MAVAPAASAPTLETKPPAGASQRISLSLTAAYAPSWGLWEGIRELVQNWHDCLLSDSDASPSSSPSATSSSSAAAPAALAFAEAAAADGESLRFVASRHRAGAAGAEMAEGAEVGFCEYLPSERRLVLVNRRVGLGRQVLLLGYSRKAQHADVIGSFGEGLKVGAVALLRNGLRLRMLTKAESWTFELAIDPAFGERVLCVEASPRPEVLDLELEGLPASLGGVSISDTATVLDGMGPEEWLRLSQRFLFLRPPTHAVLTKVGRLLLDPNRAGDIFVKGVWINSDPDVAAGADLFDIPLDRDRVAVPKKSDLQQQISAMWALAVHHKPELQERYYELLAGERQCSDIAFAACCCTDTIAKAMATAFKKRHGELVPVSLMDSNSSKADELRRRFSTSTVVCSQALLAVLKKGGVRCDLDDLLQEKNLQARRAIPLAELSEDETSCLALVCTLAEKAESVCPRLIDMVDVFESEAAMSLQGVVAKAEAFATTGRLELDRRALGAQHVHSLLPNGRCLAAGGAIPRRCRCRESVLTRAIMSVREPGVAAFANERLLAFLTSAALGAGEASGGAAAVSSSTSTGLQAIGGALSSACSGCFWWRPIRCDKAEDEVLPRVLRCPQLGADRESSLRRQIDAVETTLRNAHAHELRSLQQRVAEDEKELSRAEFKFRDAADAEQAVRRELEPELERLRVEAREARASKEALGAKAEEAAALGREVGRLRRCADDATERLAAAEAAAERRCAAAEGSAAGLRRKLAQRRELLQRMLLREDPSAAVAAGAGGGEERRLRAAEDEILEALRSEEAAAPGCCCVCLEAEACAVLLPCRHQRLCMGCANALARCPICRSDIESRMQVFA